MHFWPVHYARCLLAIAVFSAILSLETGSFHCRADDRFLLRLLCQQLTTDCVSWDPRVPVCSPGLISVPVNCDRACHQVTVPLVLWNIGQPRSSVATCLPPRAARLLSQHNLNPYKNEQIGDKNSFKKQINSRKSNNPVFGKLCSLL